MCVCGGGGGGGYTREGAGGGQKNVVSFGVAILRTTSFINNLGHLNHCKSSAIFAD